jgi:predicted PurR-regulated permease PerM
MALEESRVSPRTVYTGIGLFFGLLVSLYFVYLVHQILLAFLLAFLFAVVLDMPVSYLARRGLPRALGVLAVIGTLVGLVWLFGIFLAPAVREQARELTEQLPALLGEVETLIEPIQGFFGLGIGPDPEDLLNAAWDSVSQGRILEAAAGVGTTLVTAVSLGVVVLLAALYLTARPQPWVNGFVSLFPANRRQRVREVLKKLHHTIQRWVLGQLVAMVFIGASSAVALHFIGVPFALLLGIFAGLIAFVPYLGAIVGGIPAVLLALVSDPVLAVWVLLAYTAIQQFEGYVVQPIVMSQAVSLRPALVLFTILVMGKLFGVMGVILAVPFVAALQVLVNELWVKRMDRMGEDPNSPRPEKNRRNNGVLGPLRKALEALRSSRRGGGGRKKDTPEGPARRSPGGSSKRR